MEEITQPTNQIIPSSEHLSKTWDYYSTFYSIHFSHKFLNIGLKMAHLVNVSEAESILEVGCGDGLLSTEICLLKPEESKFYCSDLSVNMCKRAFSNMSKLAELMNEPLGVLNYRKKILKNNEELNIEEINLAETENNSCEIKLFNWEVIQADNENLRAFGDETIDAYIASLSLNIVTNPDEMIRECLRVLKPGGKAAFSVWGLKEKKNYYSLEVDLVKEMEKYSGIQFPENIRTHWHLNDRKKLIDKFKKNGFEKVLGFYDFNPFERFDEKYLDEYTLEYLTWGQSGLNFDEADLFELRKIFKKKLSDVQELENLPNGFSVLIIVVEKC